VSADNPSLTQARRAVKDVRYDDAQQLLVAALERGGNTPAELREIYLLSAATAVVLGQAELGEQYYRRVLALDPTAKLPTDVSPKLRERFVAAKAFMAAQTRLEIRAERQKDQIRITVIGDPLNMIAKYAAIAHGEPLPVETTTTLEVPRDTGATEVRALDEHGNTLATTAIVDEPAEATPAPHHDEPHEPAETPLVRRWQTWAIPAGVAAAVGIGFFIDARLAKGELDDILASSSTHFLADAESQRQRWQNDMLVTEISLAAASAFAVTAIVMRATAPVSPQISPHTVGVAIAGKF
jgi:hypothetical protein